MTQFGQTKTRSEITKERIKKDLSAIGLGKGDIVLVHSALRNLGWVRGGEDTVVDALLEIVGREGTVMVPTLTGNASLGPDHPPVFDPCHTPCWTGRIPEAFRKRSDAIRSTHPTHSVAAIGRLAKSLTADHHLAPTPCGLHSPYWRLADEQGWVLLLGVDLECCTLFHTIEELAGSAYHLQPQKVMATILHEGRWISVPTVIHRYGTPRRFMRLENEFIHHDIERRGKVGLAESRLIHAKAMVDYALERMKTEPLILVDREASEA